MRPFKIGVQSGALQRATNDAANGAEAKTVPRSPHTDKQLARRTRRTNVTQIVDQCRTHILRQRQSLQSLTFAAHDDLAALPVQVFQAHREHFATAQTESSQEQQDRVITLAGRRAAIAALKQSLDLIGRERLGQVRQSPVSDARQPARRSVLIAPRWNRKRRNERSAVTTSLA